MRSRSSLGWALACLPVLAAAQTAPRQVPATQTAPAPMDQPDEKSQAASLATLKALVGDHNYKKLGFQDRNEVASAVFGLPIRRYIVRPDKLFGYRDGIDPASTVADTAQWVYPVLVKGEVRCAVTIAWMRDIGWKANSFGDRDFARVMFATRKEESATLVPSTEDPFFLVDVLSARREFIARRNDNNPPGATPGFGKVLFTWVGPPPGDNQKTQPAEVVLRYLSKVAQSTKARGRGR